MSVSLTAGVVEDVVTGLVLLSLVVPSTLCIPQMNVQPNLAIFSIRIEVSRMLASAQSSCTTSYKGFQMITRRTWYKKGEYRLRKPHGTSENSFRSGDGWSWLNVRRYLVPSPFNFTPCRITTSTSIKLRTRCK